MEAYYVMTAMIGVSTTVGAAFVVLVVIWVTRLSWKNDKHIQDILAVLTAQMDIATNLIEEEVLLLRSITEDVRQQQQNGGPLRRASDHQVLGDGPDGTHGRG